MKNPDDMTDDELLAALGVAPLREPAPHRRKRLILTVNGRSPSQLYRDAGRILGTPKRRP